MFVLHLILGIFYIGFPLLAVLYYRTYHISQREDRFFFTLGFLLKIFGAASAVLIYIMYYGGGDTTEYFQSGTILMDYLLNHFDQLPSILAKQDLSSYNEFSFIQNNPKHSFWYTKSTYTMTKISLILNIITFNSFYLTSILCSYFSFYCSWKFYRFISDKIERRKNLVGYAIFLTPSVIFWGSGLFKDTFTLGGLYLFIIGLVNLLGYNRWRISNFIYIILGIYLLFSIRSFFLMASLPFITLWIISLRFQKIPLLSIRLLILPFFLAVTAISIFGGIYYLTQFFQELSIEQLISTSKGFQSYHGSIGGSHYNLGEIEYTLNSLLTKIPESIEVTFFRPYIWEVDKPLIFISALQSFVFLIITVYCIMKMRIIFFFTSFFSTPQAIALMGFSLFYGVVVGFTSYNFGALDRYKIPCLSTYLIALIFIWEKYNIRFKVNGQNNG